MRQLYDKYVLPHVVHAVCGIAPAMRQRQKVVPAAAGVVLELGLGSGHNLSYYDAGKVTRVFGLDPSPEMHAKARRAIARSPVAVEVLKAPAEQVPLEDTSVDTVVVTYTLCTIPDVAAALAEVRRVLRPGGRLLFCEHGLAPDASVRLWQRRIGPLWRPLSGGCHLDRPIPALLEAGGLEIESLDTLYLPGWRPATFNYWGSARVARPVARSASSP